MSTRDWDKELAEIDRRLAAIPEAPADDPAAAPGSPAVPGGRGGGVAPGSIAADARPAPPPRAVSPTAPARAGAVATPATPTRRDWRATLALLLRLAVGGALVAALVYWPYPARCGVALTYYLAVAAALALAGLATSVAAWRHRAPLVHLLGLAMLVAAGGFAAREVLPKVGYAFPSERHPAAWACE